MDKTKSIYIKPGDRKGLKIVKKSNLKSETIRDNIKVYCKRVKCWDALNEQIKIEG